MLFFLSSWTSYANTEVVQNYVSFERWAIGNVLNVIRIFGIGVALIVLTAMSISYFSADGRSFPGAAERKADIKGHQLANVAVGIALFLGATSIMSFIAEFVIDIMKEVFG